MSKAPRATTNLQLAGIVARHVQIQSINLVSATLTSNVDPRAPIEDIELSQMHRASYEVKTGEVEVSTEFRFSGHEQESEKEIIDLTGSYKLIYSLDTEDELPELAFEHFAKLNGPYNAWPYWRELVQTVAGRVGLGAIVLPVYRPKMEKVSPPAEEGGAEEPTKTAEAGASPNED